MEQIFKRFKEKDLHLDTSSQPTEKYKNRFIGLFEDILKYE